MDQTDRQNDQNNDDRSTEECPPHIGGEDDHKHDHQHGETEEGEAVAGKGEDDEVADGLKDHLLYLEGIHIPIALEKCFFDKQGVFDLCLPFITKIPQLEETESCHGQYSQSSCREYADLWEEEKEHHVVADREGRDGKEHIDGKADEIGIFCNQRLACGAAVTGVEVFALIEEVEVVGVVEDQKHRTDDHHGEKDREKGSCLVDLKVDLVILVCAPIGSPP